jgi:nitrogen fixation/metabolism regulation signal transduction histidine kinase
MNAFSDILVALIPGLLIAIVTSLVTVRLSLRSFYSQRWWEKKAEAYTSIVEALYNMKTYIEAYCDALEQGKDFREDEQKHLQVRAADGRDQVLRAATIGSFLISPEAAGSLAQLRKELRTSVNRENLVAELTEHAAIVTSHLDQLRDLAKKDLRVS